MSFRRGFKAEANEIGAEVRSEIGLEPLDRLDPRKLAAHLEIPILDLREMARSAPALGHLLSVEPEVFSAVTVFRGTRRTIVHNDGHADVRQTSNLTHELAHGLLLHPPTAALDDSGCRNWNQDLEDEATWLAGVLLVTEAATIALVRSGWSLEQAARQYGVSQQMIRFRVNATGANRRVLRARGGRVR